MFRTGGREGVEARFLSGYKKVGGYKNVSGNFKNVFSLFRDSPALTQLILLYVYRSYHVWKENDLLSWLERNVHKVLDRVDNGDPVVQDYETKRSKRYQGQMPLSITRHIILADIKGVSPLTNVN